MKKLLAILLCVILVTTTLLVGCNVKTKDLVQQSEDESISTTERGPIPLNLLTLTRFETEANVVRDQLKKAGFDVKMNIQPDYSSFFTQVDARNYDIQLLSMKVLSGNPDYACRSMFHSKGVDNVAKIIDTEIDKLIDLGSSTIGQQSLDAYTQLERLVVEENAYFIPVYRMMNSYGFNKQIVKAETMSVGQSRYQLWREIDFNDSTLRDTQPLIFSSNQAVGQFDPITQDGTHRMVYNANIRLIDLTDDDELTHEGTLSYADAIAEGNADFYFILRDDVNFAKVEDMKAVDSGIRVGAEDVLYTIKRLMDKDSVPGNKVYDNYQIVKGIERVMDIGELENTIVSGSKKTVKEALEENAPAPITELMDNKENVNNLEGKYEVVKLTTKEPFPQILNFLCGYETGIVCKEQLKKINNFNVATFDPSKDIRYGDAKLLMEGSTYNNQMYFSGAYAILYINDYEVVAEKNPGFMPNSKTIGKIKRVVTKIISDQDASISALRSGEILISDVPSNLVKVVESDPKLGIVSRLINGVVNIQVNLDNDKITSNKDIRKAILYAVNQDEVVSVMDGMGGKAYTAITMLDTGNEQNADSEKVKMYLNNYYKAIGK